MCKLKYIKGIIYFENVSLGFKNELNIPYNDKERVV